MSYVNATYTTSDGTVYDVSGRKGMLLVTSAALGWERTYTSAGFDGTERKLSGSLAFADASHMAEANDLMARCALDMDNFTPGTLEVDGWKLRCFIASASATTATPMQRTWDVDLVAPDPTWYRETRYEFMPASGTSSDMGGIDHEYDFPHDYGSTARGWKLEVASIAPCDFRLTIYGYAAKPSIYIGGNRYGADVTVPAGGLLVIDSTKKRSMKGDSVVLSDRYGNSQDVFAKRVRGAEGSGSYIYERIKHGTHDVTWDQGWGFSLDLIERAVAIPWT